MPAERDRPRLPAIPPRLGPLLVLITVLALAGVAAATAARRNSEREREGLDRAARETATAIDRRMQAYTDSLYSTASLFESSRNVTRFEFANFVRGSRTLERYPGVRSVGFGRLLAGPPRRLVIEQLEPRTDADRAIGLDLLAEPRRRTAALRALATGRAQGTPPLRALLGNTSQRVFLIFTPAYDPHRRWSGTAFAGFRMGDLMHGILGRTPAGTDVDVYDVGRASAAPLDESLLVPRRLTYDSGGGPDAAHRDKDRSRIVSLDVAGRRWAVYYAQMRTSLTGLERAAPWAIAIGGIILGLLAAALLRSQVTSEERAIALVDRRTAELRERERELQRSNEELEHFAYLASHDLQEPLRTITAYVSLLERRLGDDLDERTASWLGFVSDSARRMSELISDLLEYSRAGQTREEPEPVDLGDAWDAAVANLSQAIDEAGGRVTRGDLPVVAGSRRQMVSMLQNLIANGLKYRGERAPEVRADAVQADGGWELRISDNGIGIEPRFHDRIFGLFQRLHTADEYPGTGMGLAIVKKLSEANGGAVRVESEAGSGSTFVITLPAREG